MALIRDVSTIANKWASVTPGRSGQYREGVANPLRDWAAEAKAAEGSYEAGIQAAIGRKAFGKGVGRAGTGKWKRKAVDVGTVRWGPGVSAAKPDYEAGFAPYAGVISSVKLPPRGAKGDPRNLERVGAVANALHAKKIAMGK